MASRLTKFHKDIAGVGWLSGALLLALSLGSYSATDPSFNSFSKKGILSNVCGYFGSFLSDSLYQVWGLSSWILVIALVRMALITFQTSRLTPTRTELGISVLFIVAVSSLLDLHGSQMAPYGGAFLIGGAIGHAIKSVMVAGLNTLGAAVILWATLLAMIIYYTQKSVNELTESPRRFAANVFWGFVANIKKQITKKLVKTQKIPVRDPQRETQNEPAFKDKGIEEAKKILAASASLTPTSVSPAHSQAEEEITEIRVPKNRIFVSKATRRVENWELPKISMLEAPPSNGFRVDQKLIGRNTQLLEEKLSQFNIRGQVVAVRPGPAVTMFEFKPSADVKVSRINDFADDISLALSSESVRIIAPLPGRDVVGIETSNPKRDTVYLHDILEDQNFWDEKMKLPLALGKQANGETRVVDLRKMPHLLVAGTTGSGKSVFVVSILTGLLFKHSPKTLKLILIDPKQVDLAAFHEVPHLLMPPIRETKKAVTALKWAIKEMEKRYRSMSKFGARGIEAFNDTVTALSKSDIERHEEEVKHLEESAPHETYYYQQQPYIVVVVEEFGDLMAVDKNNVEQCVVRLAQMARACGIHLVLAMQSPRKDVVTGLIKTNIPGRVSFKVASKMDSRIILDDSGAERLLATGDMLFLAPGVGKPERHHGAWLPEKDIHDVTKFWSAQAGPDFDKAAMKMLEGSGGGYDFDGPDDDSGGGGEGDYDEMYDQILADIAGMKEVSASLLQRKFRLGYPRAARLIELFEREGVVGPANGSKPRQVLVNKL